LSSSSSSSSSSSATGARGSCDDEAQRHVLEEDLNTEELEILDMGNEQLRQKQRFDELLQQAMETEKRSKVLIKDTHHAAVREKLKKQYKDGKIPIKRWLRFWSSRADKLAQIEVTNLMSVLRQSGIAGLEDLPVEGRSLLRVFPPLAKKAGVTFPEILYLNSAKGHYSYYGLETGLLGKSIGNYHHDLAAFLEIVAAECPAMFGLYNTGSVLKPANMDTSILGAFWHKTITRERQQQLQHQDNDHHQQQVVPAAGSSAAAAAGASMLMASATGDQTAADGMNQIPQECCFRCFKCTDVDGTPIPHFFFDFFNDGIQVFNNSVKKSMVVMMARLHSISPCFHHRTDDSLRILAPNLYPFVISVFHGFKGGDPADSKEWMQDFIADLMRLDGRNTAEEGLQKAKIHQPRNTSPATLKERKMTAEIRIVIADGPGRQKTKECRGCMAYCHCEWCTQAGTIGKIFIRKQKEELERQRRLQVEELERQRLLAQITHVHVLGEEGNHEPPMPQNVAANRRHPVINRRGQKRPLPTPAADGNSKQRKRARRLLGRGRGKEPTQLNVVKEPHRKKALRQKQFKTFRKRNPPIQHPKIKELWKQHYRPNANTSSLQIAAAAVQKSVKRALQISATVEARKKSNQEPSTSHQGSNMAISQIPVITSQQEISSDEDGYSTDDQHDEEDDYEPPDADLEDSSSSNSSDNEEFQPASRKARTRTVSRGGKRASASRRIIFEREMPSGTASPSTRARGRGRGSAPTRNSRGMNLCISIYLPEFHQYVLVRKTDHMDSYHLDFTTGIEVKKNFETFSLIFHSK
jgi:hypothetical protein